MTTAREHAPCPRRQQLEDILTQWDMGMWHWIMLCVSSKWTKNKSELAEKQFSSIRNDGLWLWHGIHVPDVTERSLSDSDRDLFARGLVTFIDHRLATLMVGERSQFDPSPVPLKELLNVRILTPEGWTIWQQVEGAMSASAKPILTGEIVGGREIHHLGLPFSLDQCCAKCLAGIGLKEGEGTVFEVGPWYSKYYWQVMPKGWRLICPHSERPVGFVRRTSI